MEVTCPHCGIVMDAEEEDVGLEADCPSCGQAFTLPAPSRPANKLRLASRPSPGHASAPPPPAGLAPMGTAAALGAAPPAGSCPGCGQPLDDKAVICINCGYNRKTGQHLQTQANQAAAYGPSAALGPPATHRSGGVNGSAVVGGLVTMVAAVALFVILLALGWLFWGAPFMFLWGLWKFIQGLMGGGDD